MKPIETLPQLARWQADTRGEATALLFEDRHLSYNDLNKHSIQIASGLLEEGIRPQSRIALLAKDSDYGYELVFGCAAAQAVLVPVNWKLSPTEILYILRDSEAEVLFVGEEFFGVAELLAMQLPELRKIITIKGAHSQWPSFAGWRYNQPTDIPVLDYDPEAPVLQMYTSGTTGHPKGVQLAHYTFFRLLQGMKAQGDNWMDLNPDDVILVTVPMFHIGGLWWGIQSLAAGATGILLESFIGWKVLESIPRYKVSKIAMVPAMLQFCLAEPACSETDFSSVKAILYGGSPMTPALMRKALQTFGCDFFQIYGLTETGNMAVCARPADHNEEGTIRRNVAGKPLPGVEAKITDPQGNILPPGKTGEICLHSPSRMIGYWRNEQATEATLRDGWIYTGDGGYMDEDGYIYVADRIKDMIICAGENIYPAEVEAALAEHPDVADVAVIGIPDDLWGEAVKAFVVLKPGHIPRQRALIQFVRARIADFKVPKSISFVDSLPRNPSGKIVKRILREPFWIKKERLVN